MKIKRKNGPKRKFGSIEKIVVRFSNFHFFIKNYIQSLEIFMRFGIFD